MHELAGDLVQRGAGLAQHARGAGVEQLALAERQALVDGVAYERVHEPGRRLGAQDLGPRERGHRARDLGLVEPGHAGHRPEVGALAEDGDGAGDGGRLAGQPREPQQHGARHGARADRAHHVGVRRVGLDRFGLERVQELADEQRVAAGGAMAGLAEQAVGLGAEAFRHELADGVLAERAGPDVRGGRVVGDLGQQRGVGRRVAGADAGGDEHRLAFEAPDQVGEEPQRRAVAPLEVVDLEQQRALGGQVERQPVQAVERREGRVAGRRSLVGRGEHHARRGGGAGQRVGIGDDGLEELADDAEREVPLQLAGARVEDHRAAGVRVAPELRQQP